MKYAKRIASFICVIALCFTLVCTPSAHASGLLGGQAAGAWIGAGLVALNIVADIAIGTIGNYFGWQGHPTNTALLERDIQYTFPIATETISNYMNASTIKVSQGVVTIDGIEYDELWLGPEWSQALKTNLFDFKTKWNVLSGQAGTLVSGAGHVWNMPFYNVNGVIRSQDYVTGTGFGVYKTGDAKVDVGFTSNRYVQFKDPTSAVYGYTSITNYNGSLYYTANPNRLTVFYLTPSGDYNNGGGVNGHFVFEPFKFDYVSGIVPANPEDIPDDYGISLKIPHDKLETFYNTYPQYNVDNTVINIGEDQVDINELTNAIFDLIESMDEIKAEWTNGEEPEPPAPVDPIENIDQNVQDISEYQQDMQQQVDHMHQDVESIHQTQQAQQETQQDIAETSESIDNTLMDIKDTLAPEQITEKTFDLRELFPFCIPFDIYHLLQKFDGTPTAPHVQLPIVIPSIGFSYIMDLDFSAWDPVASAMRTVELIVYALGLAWATSKVIKW